MTFKVTTAVDLGTGQGVHYQTAEIEADSFHTTEAGGAVFYRKNDYTAFFPAATLVSVVEGD